MVLELPIEVAEALAAEAHRRGTTPEVLAVDYIRQHLPSPVGSHQEKKGTAADYLAEFIGIFDSSELVPGGARLSEKSGRDFAEMMRQKRAHGKL